MSRFLAPDRVALAYLLCGIITFGHAFNAFPRNAKSCEEEAVMVGLLGAMCWPLYLSARAWETESVASEPSVSESIPVEGGAK